MAAAPVAATAIQVRRLGQSAKLQRFAYELVNGVPELLEGFLGVNEVACDGILQQDIPLPVEFVDLGLAELDALCLLVMQMFSLLADRHVLGAGFVIDHELIDVESMGFEIGL